MKTPRCGLCGEPACDWRVTFIESNVKAKNGYPLWEVLGSGPACKRHRGFYFVKKDGNYVEEPDVVE